MAAGCSGSSEAADSDSEPAPEAQLTVTPEDGSTGVGPDAPIAVEVEDGAITDVSVEAAQGGEADEAAAPAEPAEDGEGGEDGAAGLGEITGTLSEDDTVWTSDWTLPPGTDVVVTATAENADGEESELVSEFSTQAAPEGPRLAVGSTFPADGDTVGVGMPVILNFDLPVENKAQVEAAVEVLSEEPVEAAANWVTDQQMVIRPAEYWAPYQEITVNAHLAGVQYADGQYADENYQFDFEIGREMITEMHIPDYEMEVSVDGEVVESFPVSNGEGTQEFNTTMSGIQLTMEKYDFLTMDSASVGIPEGSPGYYRVDVRHAVRISNSGEFTHGAPYHNDHGRRNVSHGCTNMRAEDAQWFYDESLMGDPVIKTGSDREMEWDNGWGFWQRSWEEWLDNSELGEPQNTGQPGTPDAEPVGS